jgi:hypothetical protein
MLTVAGFLNLFRNMCTVIKFNSYSILNSNIINKEKNQRNIVFNL